MIKSKSHLLAALLPSTSCCMDADGFVEEGSRWYKALVNTALPTQGSLTPSAAEARALKQCIREAKRDSLGEYEIHTMLATRRASRQSF